MHHHLKKLSEETIHQNPWWAYKHDVFANGQGRQGDYYYGETKAGMAMVVPVLPDGRLVLVLQYRYLDDKQSIEFPAGGIGDDGSALEAAKRELLEETGCLAEDYVKLGEFQASNGLLKDKSHVFLAQVIEQKPARPDEGEEIEVIYRRPDEVDEMVKKNEIWDGQTLAAWALVHHHFLHKY